MIDRRLLLLGIAASLAAAPKTGVKPVSEYDLPDIKMEGWSVRAVEVTYPPGGSSAKHKHPGFVLACVLEGAIRSQVAGQPAAVYTAGQTFYEPPGSVHAVSENASKTNPAKLLAFIFAPKGSEVSLPA